MKSLLRSGSVRAGFPIAFAIVLSACGDGPANPSGNRLEFTFTPNPVSPVATPACLPGTVKNWFWTVSVRNPRNEAFAVTGFETTTTAPGIAPLITQGTTADFITVFGTSTVAAGATLQSLGPVCAGLTVPPSGELTISYLVRGQSGDSVRTPTLRLLP